MSFLLGNWKMLAIGSCLLIVSAILGLQRHKINSLEREKVELTAAYQLMAAKVSEQNQAILRLGEDKKKADAKRARAIKNAEDMQRIAQGKIDAFNALPVRSSGICEDDMAQIKRLLEVANGKHS